MPLPRRTFLTGLAGTAGVTAVSCSGTTADGAAPHTPASGAAAEAARRLLPRHWNQIEFRTAPKEAGAEDSFRVTGRRGRITVTGATPAVQLTGLRHYLKHVTRADITWAGSRTDHLPDRLPAPGEPLTGAANTPHRFVLNDTNDGYTGAYYDWDYWEHEIDVFALHGYNEVLVYAGADAVYHRAFQEFGYSDAELRAWIPGPAHQPWWLLQNMASFPHPVSRQLLDARARLGRRICDRLRDLGMTPVLPGWFGTVPPDFEKKNPGARTVPQGDWVGFARPDWLDPRTGHFARVAAAFYRAQDELYGPTTMYKMDLLHEGGKPGDVPVGDAAKGVEKALRAAHPDATWVILGWQHNPPKAITDAVDKKRMLVVDGLSDRFPHITDRESDWGSTPYTFGSIWNFGGHTTLGANTPDWAALYEKWRTKKGSTLSGISLMPEAADNNPAAFELFSELAWRDGDLDLESWFREWSASRYGAADPHAEAAWDILRRTAYGTTRADKWAEGADGLFGARPDLAAKSAAAWSPKKLRYDAAAFEPALGELLSVRAGLRNSSAYRRDLLDVARQALSNRSRVLLPRVKEAYDAGDAARFERLTREWLTLMDLLERLVATDSRHLLGRWIADARAWGADAAERDRLAYDQLSLLTVWGTRSGAEAGLRDYANREWAGLVGGLYRSRWERYFKELRAALAENRAPEKIDWFAMEEAWTENPGRLATRPKGDTHKAAAKVWDHLKRDGGHVKR
ncbi:MULTISPECIES: alpha-N-acetylglucosaminidase [unclassified Streptomyces]|uniref:alpha-N-acetylglucosaminidase n=1 Tax=unclassified Streptomyces TaxID=2593676 RepID=UPI00136D13C4|nr:MULTISPECIES: alpha-N-acetylglucosaminidase [unclassified Streptomyces]NEA03227.1 alpha-N-acetylglucosaminidase [Streptomyces sp. SID10116]MYY85443.1 alpha-N-acetylglucosaminidase [Streptomyces sp. SID335]MYZ13558.1 alpha-N-acetylglucosaminidase [Streptomyces sp. SID337]NDZ87331.1 alpha-N-acetylglucosaminidase [Streptomyces sp. SID10115]NEB48502.1 alpha-N-acetylglucosaminidase [Streptomyces sp. SID339]